MHDDEMINSGYDDEELFCYLSEVDINQDVISKFLEMVMGKTFQSSKDYGARIAHRGKESSLVDKIFPIFSKKFDNNVTLFFNKTNIRNNKSIVKSNELPQKDQNKITIDDNVLHH